MKLAVEALEWNWGGEPLPTKELEAMTALRQAIEQAEKQEHDLNDVRCECCGYMTYHREHMATLMLTTDRLQRSAAFVNAAFNDATSTDCAVPSR